LLKKTPGSGLDAAGGETLIDTVLRKYVYLRISEDGLHKDLVDFSTSILRERKDEIGRRGQVYAARLDVENAGIEECLLLVKRQACGLEKGAEAFGSVTLEEPVGAHSFDGSDGQKIIWGGNGEGSVGEIAPRTGLAKNGTVWQLRPPEGDFVKNGAVSDGETGKAPDEKAGGNDAGESVKNSRQGQRGFTSWEREIEVEQLVLIPINLHTLSPKSLKFSAKDRLHFSLLEDCANAFLNRVVNSQ